MLRGRNLKERSKSYSRLTISPGAPSVHEARKHLKKVRALIRLLRPATGEAFYKEEKCRDAQSGTADVDSHVRVQTIEKLTVKSGKRRTPAAFARIRTAMAARLRQVIEESEKEDWSKQAAVEIEGALGSWKCSGSLSRTEPF